MNSALLHKIADRIEAEPERYDQATYSRGSGCKTAYCVAGWAIAIAKPELLTKKRRLRARVEAGAEARRLLGLTIEEAGALFAGNAGPKLGHTPSEALHKMAEMGYIDPEIWGRPQ